MSEAPPITAPFGFEIIDTPVEKLFYWRAMIVHVLAAIGVMVLWITAVELFQLKLGWVGGAASGGLMGFSGGILTAFLSRRAKLNITERLQSTPQLDIRNQVEEILEKTNRLVVVEAFRHFLIELSRRSIKSIIIRLWPEEHLKVVTPILVPIEPIALDEADAAFDEFSEAVGDDVKRSRMNRYEATPLRRLNRNRQISGNWILVILLGLSVVSVIHSLITQRLNEGLVIFPAALVILSFIRPISFGKHGKNSWFLVSGGVVVHSISRWKQVVSQHLFDARKCLLCVYRMRGNTWGFIVADAERCETRVATKRELDLLLRVWTSPVPPPTMEQLEALMPG